MLRSSSGESAEAAEDAKPAGFVRRLRARLNRGDSWLTYDLANLLPGGRIDEGVLDELETRLIERGRRHRDDGQAADGLRGQVARNELANLDALLRALRESMLAILSPSARPLEIEERKPFVILVVGVNGSGKTTTIGKLAKRCVDGGLQVMLAAGDTFRAAAIEQLQIWGRPQPGAGDRPVDGRRSRRPSSSTRCRRRRRAAPMY